MSIYKPVCLGLPRLKLNKKLWYEFRYDYVKPKYGKKQSCIIWIQIVSLYT